MIAAVGIPHLVRGDWIKRGAFVIDVGLNYIHVGKAFYIFSLCVMCFAKDVSFPI